MAGRSRCSYSAASCLHLAHGSQHSGSKVENRGVAKRLMMGGASSHRSSYSSIQLSGARQGTREVLVSFVPQFTSLSGRSYT